MTEPTKTAAQEGLKFTGNIKTSMVPNVTMAWLDCGTLEKMTFGTPQPEEGITADDLRANYVGIYEKQSPSP